jgi:hypothetical protein
MALVEIILSFSRAQESTDFPQFSSNPSIFSTGEQSTRRRKSLTKRGTGSGCTAHSDNRPMSMHQQKRGKKERKKERKKKEVSKKKIHVPSWETNFFASTVQFGPCVV